MGAGLDPFTLCLIFKVKCIDFEQVEFKFMDNL